MSFSQVIIRNKNPYPGSCGLSNVKSIDLRDERGALLKVTNADANIAVGFDRETVEEATSEEEGVPTDVAMVLVNFELNKPGACGVEVFLETEKTKNTCVQIFSRKLHPPTADSFDQMVMVRGSNKKGKKRRVLINDLEYGNEATPPAHYLGYRVVNCAKSNVSSDFVMTSPVMETALNISFESYVHCCTFWDPTNREWSGEGCKVCLEALMTYKVETYYENKFQGSLLGLHNVKLPWPLSLPKGQHFKSPIILPNNDMFLIFLIINTTDG